MTPLSLVTNEDCMSLMARYPDKYFELAVVDPPYGIGEGGQRNLSGDRPTKKWKNPNSINYKPFDDSTPPDENYFKELFRVSKNQIVFGGNYFTAFLFPSMGWIIWDKGVDEKEHLSMFEMAWSSFQRKAMKFELLWAGFKKGEPTERIHPTQKPMKLYYWLLKNYAKPGDKILDTHLGSGSSRIAAYKLGFDFVGCELDKDYFDAQEKRFHTAIAEPLFNPPVPPTQAKLL
ncbi:MAG TPA: DNA methyltransferase [Ignavibacteriaceae bacterium]